jgi:perosamine synthetase
MEDNNNNNNSNGNNINDQNHNNMNNEKNNNNFEQESKLAIEGGKPVRDSFLPYATQWIGEEEKKEILEVLDSNWLTTGPKVRQFEEDIAQFVGAKYAIAVNSGTAALHCCVGALNLKPGDEVITTPFTFLATANVIVYRGATPVLVDIDSETYNLDPVEIRKKITPRTKAIIPVHYGGHPCNMDEIKKIAEEHDLKIIEDAAHALSAEYKGQKIGGIGDMSIFSFHPVKNITTGEGGIITTNDPELARLCVMHRTHGITKEAMERYGKNADWMYDMQRLGHRYNMTEFQGALGIAQLKKIGMFQEKREAVVKIYEEAFSNIPEIVLPVVKDYAKSAWHLYPIRIKEEMLKEGVNRNLILKALKAENVGVNVHYIPIHLHSYYQKNYGFSRGEFPVTEKIYDSILTLPLFPKMSDNDVQDVIKVVNKVIEHYRR